MCRASFAAVVVLPEPWRPTSEITAGLPCRWNVRSPADSSVDELVVDDLHDLLARAQAGQDLRADRLLADPADEVLHDLEVDVGLEQRQPDLAHRRIDVGLADAAAAGQAGERLAQSIAEGVEHEGGRTPKRTLGSWRGSAPRGRARGFWRADAGECSPVSRRW